MGEKEARDMGWEEMFDNPSFDTFVERVKNTIESGLTYEVFLFFLRELNVRPEVANEAMYHAMCEWDI